MHSDPIPRLETVQSHKQNAKINNILIYDHETVPRDLKRYINVTLDSKRNNSPSRNILFISYIKSYKAAKTSTILG